MSRRLGNALLLLAVIALVAVSLVLGSRHASGDGEKFVGSDSVAAEAVAESGHERWFEPLFSPDSGEVESGLFALQAAIGAGILGYCLGRLHGRRRERAAAGRDADPTTIPAAEAAAAGTSPDIAHPIEPHRRTAGSATP